MKKNKITAAVMAVAMAAVMLSGCGAETGDVKPESTAQTTENPSTEAENNNAGNSTIVDGHTRMNQEVTLSYLIYEHTDWPVKDDTPVRDRMFEATNVRIESIVAPATNFDEKFNANIMAKKLPDLMMGNNINTLNEYGQKGVFLPLEDLIAEYAPNINARLDERARKMVTASDGHIYALPRFGQDRLRTAWLIRKYWLDDLGLEVPATTEEWIEVLRAFKEKDPGNAGDRLVPLMNRSGSSVFLLYSAPTFGLHPENYTKMGDSYVLNAYTEEYRNMVEWYRTLYEEGLFDKEFVTTSSKQWEEAISAGYVGAFVDFANRADTFTAVLREQDEDAEFVVAPPPVGPTGVQGVPSYSDILTTTCVSISKDCKDVEAALAWLDYLYSEDGSWLTSVGIEGVTYTGVDENGAPVWTEEIANNPNNMSITSKYGIQQQMCPRVLTEYEFQLIQGPLTLAGKELCEPYYVDPYFPVKYTEEEAEQMTNYNSAVTPVINQYTDQFISGALPMSEWETFQKELKTLGAEQMGEIFTAAQSRMGE